LTHRLKAYATHGVVTNLGIFRLLGALDVVFEIRPMGLDQCQW